MKGKLAALFLALILTLSLPTAFAADSRIESVEYKGFGILKIEFTRDCDWYASSVITLTDTSGTEIPYVFLGGEAEESYLRAETLTEDTEFSLDFTLGETRQNISLRAETGTKFKVDANGNTKERKEDDRCDLCRERGHDDDYCPQRIDANTLPTNPDELARLFDIDRCERCGGMGHDDDRCTGR